MTSRCTGQSQIHGCFLLLQIVDMVYFISFLFSVFVEESHNRNPCTTIFMQPFTNLPPVKQRSWWVFGEQCCPFTRITEHRICVACNSLRKVRMPEAWNVSWLGSFLSFDYVEPSLMTIIIWSLMQCLPLGRMDYSLRPPPDWWWPKGKNLVSSRWSSSGHRWLSYKVPS